MLYIALIDALITIFTLLLDYYIYCSIWKTISGHFTLASESCIPLIDCMLFLGANWTTSTWILSWYILCWYFYCQRKTNWNVSSFYKRL